MTLDFSAIVDDLATIGWSVSREFLDATTLDALIESEALLWTDGQFRQAGVGDRRVVRPEIRSDRIYWLDEAALPSAVESYWHKIEGLRQELNRLLYLGLRRFEAHFAVYPPGAYYQKHLDQVKTAPNRMVSCILYLNRDWKQDFGGQLRIYPPDAPEGLFFEVMPEAGTFVCFLSDRIVHEVLPATRERFSLTGWLRRENP